MSLEICRNADAQRNFERLRVPDLDSVQKLHDWEEREIVLYESGEPMSEGRSPERELDTVGHSKITPIEVVEKASKRDIAMRRDEQIERVERMLELGQKLTPQWREYALRNAPWLIFNKLLQRSA